MGRPTQCYYCCPTTTTTAGPTTTTLHPPTTTVGPTTTTLPPPTTPPPCNGPPGGLWCRYEYTGAVWQNVWAIDSCFNRECYCPSPATIQNEWNSQNSSDPLEGACADVGQNCCNLFVSIIVLFSMVLAYLRQPPQKVQPPLLPQIH